MQPERHHTSFSTNSVATPTKHNGGARRVTVNYEWLGERRERCFRVIDGDLVVSECQAPAPESGFGDVIAGATKAVGFKPCGSCQKRQAALNKATPGWAGKILGWFKG